MTINDDVGVATPKSNHQMTYPTNPKLNTTTQTNPKNSSLLKIQTNPTTYCRLSLQK